MAVGTVMTNRKELPKQAFPKKKKMEGRGKTLC
jgi:hypothetical protein